MSIEFKNFIVWLKHMGFFAWYKGIITKAVMENNELIKHSLSRVVRSNNGFVFVFVVRVAMEESIRCTMNKYFYEELTQEWHNYCIMHKIKWYG